MRRTGRITSLAGSVVLLNVQKCVRNEKSASYDLGTVCEDELIGLTYTTLLTNALPDLLEMTINVVPKFFGGNHLDSGLEIVESAVYSPGVLLAVQTDGFIGPFGGLVDFSRHGDEGQTSGNYFEAKGLVFFDVDLSSLLVLLQERLDSGFVFVGHGSREHHGDGVGVLMGSKASYVSKGGDGSLRLGLRLVFDGGLGGSLRFGMGLILDGGLRNFCRNAKEDSEMRGQ